MSNSNESINYSFTVSIHTVVLTSNTAYLLCSRSGGQLNLDLSLAVKNTLEFA